MWRIVLSSCLGLSGLLPWSGRAVAGTTVYQCRAANGPLTYQDVPCGKGQSQQRLALPYPPQAAMSTAAPEARTALPDTEKAAAPLPTQPAASVPRMYGCVNAVDGKPYVSKRGDPAPYLAPYGMLGAGQLPLSEAYGPTRGGAGISAPEANRGRVTAALAAGNYVWVQDQCRELTVQETCAALRDDLERNAHALDKAFRSDRPPLERRDRELRAQLQGC
jgi:hypothetical protein